MGESSFLNRVYPVRPAQENGDSPHCDFRSIPSLERYHYILSKSGDILAEDLEADNEGSLNK